MSYTDNKKAKFDFEILEKYVAGIELLGLEVKSIKAGTVSLAGAHCIVRGNEAFLVGANIPPYQQKNTPDSYDPERARRLLLSKKEIKELAEADAQKGLTLIPLSLYNVGRNIKLKLAVARGKKKHDKREALKKRDMERDARRESFA